MHFWSHLCSQTNCPLRFSSVLQCCFLSKIHEQLEAFLLDCFSQTPLNFQLLHLIDSLTWWQELKKHYVIEPTNLVRKIFTFDRSRWAFFVLLVPVVTFLSSSESFLSFSNSWVTSSGLFFHAQIIGKILIAWANFYTNINLSFRNLATVHNRFLRFFHIVIGCWWTGRSPPSRLSCKYSYHAWAFVLPITESRNAVFKILNELVCFILYKALVTFLIIWKWSEYPICLPMYYFNDKSIHRMKKHSRHWY